ncbi:sensor histidine kinase [Alicyclobacillus kakegawensis]|uniref:sensor histidine kinase n=1 Tax=Alicyclobacillus kakegawensis TaxID=392012 RepID=UPI00082C9BEB|nr:HAMP domain-containing sensor histidine kinase [Alicyclobacillus kakegawensis]
MRTVRIRKYMVVGVLSIVVFPWLVYCLVLQPWSQWHSPRRQVALNQVMNEIVKNPEDWKNPAWQNHLREQLADARMEATILSPSNHEVFSSGHRHGPQWMPSQQTTVVENGQVLGTVRVFASTTNVNSAVAAISALAAVMLAISFVAFQMGRQVVKPLESMSRAARQIAEGDFDFRLPVSRVTEIAQVRSGFEIMVAGLRESFQKQARLEEERRFFIGAIAHDLRTPLFALRGYLEGLEQGIANTPEKMAKYVAVCKEKSDQLDRLVSDLFAFTKLEFMEQTLHYDKVDFASVLEGSVDSLRPQAQDKAVSIIMQRPAYECVVRADAHLLERAINNLLDNALRHTPSRGEIFVKWYKAPGKIIVSVRDTGPGFSGEELNHVFDPLYRGEVSRNRATGGVGLGLTIARRIFRAHGGDLVATNHPQGGALLTGWVQDV